MGFDDIRFPIFISGLILFSILETYFSYEKRVEQCSVHRLKNLAIGFISAGFGKVLLPTGLISFAVYCERNNIGLLNILGVYDSVFILILSVLFLDLAIYLQHRASHSWTWFWKMHRVHHSDKDLDTTSALRFHPLEIGVSLAYKMALVYIFGINFYAVAIFEIILNFMAMFNHSNIYIPHKFEKFLRLFIVTPQMHLVHHSEIKEEHNSNYGFNLSIWDYLLKTYLERKEAPTGLKGVEKSLSFKELFLYPFKQ